MQCVHYLTIALATLVGSSPVSAQTSATPSSEAGDASSQVMRPDPQASTTSQGEPDAVAGDEIVVTALRREQLASRAPVALSVVGGENLQELGVVSAQNLPEVLPNIQNGVAGFAIRGISSGDTTAKGDPSTAFSIDGIYIARPQEQAFTFFDLQRVEVLRGPQGTLYGRNATAGAINVISNRPSPSGFAAAGSFEIGNYDTRRANAMINVPVSSNIAIRAAGALNRRDGFSPTSNGRPYLDDQDDISFRLSGQADITSNLRLLVVGDYTKAEPTGRGYTPVARAFTGSRRDRRITSPGGDSHQFLEIGGATVDVGLDLGFANLTYLFGRRDSTNDFVQFYADTANFVDQQNDHSQTSHELRLASSGASRLQWVAGLFYLNESAYSLSRVRPNPTLQLLFDLETDVKSFAGFAQATYSLTDSLRVTGGLRYTKDEKSRFGYQTANAGPQIPNAAEVNYSKTNWKLGIDHDLGSAGVVYATISTGYKAGGFNDGNPVSQPALYYDPEDVRAIEVGAKSRLFGVAQVSAAAFHYSYKGLQLSSVPPTGGILTLNAARATVKGAEVESSVRVGRRGRLEFSAALLDAAYDEYFPLGPTGPSFAGRRLDRSPEFTARVAYSHDFMLGDGSKIAVNGSTRYSSSYFVSNFNVPLQYTQEAFWRTDASIGYHAADDGWYVQAFARNLEDNNTISIFAMGSLAMGEPRLYGVRAGFRF